jgi:hypothetical protein
MKRIAAFLVPAALFVTGCGDHDHGPGGHTHGPPGATGVAKSGGHAAHGAPMALGAADAGPYALTTTRDEGALVAGGDAPVDVIVKPTPGAPAIVAVRAWIGTADGKGALKALLEVEDAKEPDRRHSHVEVPKPLDASHRLHVEIEAQGGAKHVASFDLKR